MIRRVLRAINGTYPKGTYVFVSYILSAESAISVAIKNIFAEFS